MGKENARSCETVLQAEQEFIKQCERVLFTGLVPGTPENIANRFKKALNNQILDHNYRLTLFREGRTPETGEMYLGRILAGMIPGKTESWERDMLHVRLKGYLEFVKSGNRLCDYVNKDALAPVVYLNYLDGLGLLSSDCLDLFERANRQPGIALPDLTAIKEQQNICFKRFTGK